MILRVLAVSMIGFTLAGCVSSSGLSGDVYSASEAKQVQSVTYGTIVHTAPYRSRAATTAMPSGRLAARFWAASSEMAIPYGGTGRSSQRRLLAGRGRRSRSGRSGRDE